jgi:Cyclin, N-terminal domain
MDVGEYFCLHPTTTHAAVAYLDRLHLSKFSRHEWQMLAVSCILIAGEKTIILALLYAAVTCSSYRHKRFPIYDALSCCTVV